MDLEAIKNSCGSLKGRSIRPLCANHHPAAKLRDGIVWVECPNCSTRAAIHPRSFLDYCDPDEPLRSQIIELLKEPNAPTIQ